jgi:hypothetical protein
MSHNPALVLVTNVSENNYELLLRKLNLDMYVRAQDAASFGHSGNVNLLNVTYDFFTDRLWVGHHRHVLILVNGPLTHEFLRADRSATEEAFIQTFPHSDIVSLSYASTSTSYSYVVIRNGEKIRVKNGSQYGTVIDSGELLPLELQLRDDDVIHPEDLEEIRAEVSSQEADAILEGMRGSTIMHELVPHYLDGLLLHHQGLESIPVIGFVKQ